MRPYNKPSSVTTSRLAGLVSVVSKFASKKLINLNFLNSLPIHKYNVPYSNSYMFSVVQFYALMLLPSLPKSRAIMLSVVAIFDANFYVSLLL